MVDTREDILSRLVTVCGSAVSGVTCYRNRTQFSEDMRPCLAVIDGDEECDASDPNRHAFSPRRITMHPEIYILATGQSENVGATVNALRASVIAAILGDATLEGSSLNDRGISYDGCTLIIEEGRATEVALNLSFSLSYVLRPDQL